MKDAVLTHFRYSLPASLFTTVLVNRAVATRQMHELLQVMRDIDRGGNGQVRPYLEAACSWLHERHLYKWLHRLQSSPTMNDHCGAAMTCESLFVKANDFAMRIGYLEQAKEHSTMAMRESVETRIARISLPDVYQSGVVIVASERSNARHGVITSGTSSSSELTKASPSRLDFIF